MGGPGGPGGARKKAKMSKPSQVGTFLPEPAGENPWGGSEIPGLRGNPCPSLWRETLSTFIHQKLKFVNAVNVEPVHTARNPWPVHFQGHQHQGSPACGNHQKAPHNMPLVQSAKQ